LATERTERQRLLDQVLSKPKESEIVDENADIRALGYDPDYMTDNEMAIARNQAADRKLLRQMLDKDEKSEQSERAKQEVQTRFVVQLNTLSECEPVPLTEEQRQAVIKTAVDIAPRYADRTPEQLATIAHAEWRKSRSKPVEKIKTDKTAVAEAPNRGVGPTRGSIPAGGNLSLNDALDAAAKAIGYTGN
jgi:hypothetical protein